jgi:uncharacterized Zn finger protein
MCKHVAATLYGVASRLDQKPELFFVLRHVDQSELLAAGTAADVLSVAGANNASSTGSRRIAQGSVAGIFGIELDATAVPQKKPNTSEGAKVTKGAKTAKKATSKATPSKATKRPAHTPAKSGTPRPARPAQSAARKAKSAKTA